MYNNLFNIVNRYNQFSDCPKCEGTLIGGDFEVDGGDIWRPVTCEKCEWSYQEVYQFTHNETIGDCRILDEHGNESGELASEL